MDGWGGCGCKGNVVVFEKEEGVKGTRGGWLGLELS